MRKNPWLRNVSLLVTGQFISLFGSSLVQYAIWWDLALRSDSGTTIMWATMFAMLPQAFISIFGGAWADRFPRKVLITLPDAAIAMVTLALAIGYATGNAQSWFIFLVLFVRSVGAGIQTPSANAFVPDITPEAQLMRVNSINGTLQALLQILAPAISAALIGTFAMQSVMFIDVITAIIGICFVLMISVPAGRSTYADMTIRSSATADREPRIDEQTATTQVQEPSPDPGQPSSFSDIKAGLIYAAHHRIVRRVLIGFALAFIICVSPTMLCSIFVNRNFAEGTFSLLWFNFNTVTQKLGFFELTYGVGAVIGGLVMTAWGGFKRRMTSLGLGITGMGLSNIIMALSANSLLHSQWLYIVSFILMGVLTPLCTAPVYTYLQEIVDPAMQGRVFGLLNTTSAFAMPIGALIAGPLADLIPIEWIFIASGILTLPLGWWIYITDDRKNIENSAIAPNLSAR